MAAVEQGRDEMRMYRSIVWLVMCLGTVVGTTATLHAQDNQPQILEEPVGAPVPVPSVQGGSAPLPGGSPGQIYSPLAPEAYRPTHGPYGGPGPAPWPNVSPFDHSFDQTANSQGLWFNQHNNYGRRYETSVEYLRPTLFAPGTDLVGDKEAFRTATTHIAGAPANDPFVEYNVGKLANQHTNGMTGFGSHGIRGRFAIINADDSMLATDLWWVGETENSWRPYQAPDMRTTQSIIESLHARGAIPLDNGISSGASGTSAEFDLDYRLGYKASAWGADIDWSPNAFLDRGPLKVRTLYGVTYMQLREEFAFSGIQSQFSYVVDNTTGQISSVVDNGLDIIYSDLFSRVNSYLAGPEIGIRYDLGGERFRVWGSTKIAVAVNNENIRLGGNNMIDAFSGIVIPTPSAGNPNPFAFISEESHLHVSPIFQQNIFAEGHVMQFVPILNKSSILREANFRVGYNFVLVGEVSRPTKLIDWRHVEPTIDINRSRWAMGTTSFGLDWKF